MKNQPNANKTGNMQGTSTADRAFTNQREEVKSKGISNGGGQRSDQTSSKDSAHQPQHKKDK
ncbi:hypothetical protein [Mucilaginibacter myungsuensis]|uniref:Uncharacterized protein n=1 Tax=Mucilaginibacter myungsuensis TaxID=649104 RepID=A0A929KT24_9SPHI|nr:hypothetical protein [Mucilaginibacter myungsuensis]MBE9660657.1 hypothetical protein [Mucilaginibacter myungsuensis]MDN3600702.1 hypothetical protein [Mucilaginibacter myungsuensis]